MRLTTWKFCLLQLAASFPRPPIGFWVGMFVINHLLGSPVDTMKNFQLMLASCQRIAHESKKRANILIGHAASFNVVADRMWKAEALIVMAYAEWDKENAAQQLM